MKMKNKSKERFFFFFCVCVGVGGLGGVFASEATFFVGSRINDYKHMKLLYFIAKAFA